MKHMRVIRSLVLSLIFIAISFFCIRFISKAETLKRHPGLQVYALSSSTAVPTETTTPVNTNPPSSTPVLTIVGTRTPTYTPTYTPSRTPTYTPSPTATNTPTPTLDSPRTYTVNTIEDVNDGVCDAVHCSLREAVLAANAVSSDDTIILGPGVYQVRILGTGEDASVSGDLDIVDFLTITGAGSGETFIEATHTGVTGVTGDHIFHIDPKKRGVRVNLSQLTIQNLTWSNSSGGGIYNSGILNMDYVALTGHKVYQMGGAIFNAGTLSIDHSSIQNNVSMYGAGIYSDTGSTLTITNSTISHNSATGTAGGISSKGTLTLINTTISHNTSGGVGSGLINEGVASLNNVTIFGNAASTSGDYPQSNGGGVFTTSLATTTVKNTIIVGNYLDGTNKVSDCYGKLNSEDYNLIGQSNCSWIGETSHNIIAPDPALGPVVDPLGDNGGPTLTHQLRYTSLAIDHGNNATCATTDQTGADRPIDADGDGNAVCDIGAVEATDNLPPVVDTPQTGPDFLVNMTEDANDGICGITHCSLRDAILASNAMAGSNTITLPAGLYLLTLEGQGEDWSFTGDLDIQDALILNGADSSTTVIDANALDRVIHISRPVSVTFSGISLQGGFIPTLGGYGTGVLNENGAQVTFTDCIITNNTVEYTAGDGIYNRTSSKVTVVNSIISNHPKGVGIYNNSSSTLIISGSLITDNAGGILNYNKSTATISESAITDNESSGIKNSDATITVKNTTISGNSTPNNGGGILNTSGGTVYLNNVSIVNNTASADDDSGRGGGIYNSSATIYIKNSIVANNHDLSGRGPDCYGLLNSQGYNLIQELSSCTIPTDHLSPRNARLGPLQDNGGMLPTHSLIPGSDAIGNGNPAIPGSTSNACEPIDQRGHPRNDGRCDIGAYEAQALPTVLLVNTIPDSGEGILLENESNAPDITQITVMFSEIMSNPDGDTEANDVTNPASYRLLRAGSDESFQTTECAVAQGDDELITMDSVTYDATLQIAALSLNGGTALEPDSYRLLVCGTTSLTDIEGNLLDGNEDGIGGDDFTRNFQVATIPDSPQTGPIFNVTVTVDSNDGNCGELHCSLREAVIAANSVPNSTVQLSAGIYQLTISGVDDNTARYGDLDILTTMTIAGAGAGQTIIDGGQLDRIFDLYHWHPSGIWSSVVQTVMISDVTLQNGKYVIQTAGGGAIAVGRSDTLTILRCMLIDNIALNGGAIRAVEETTLNIIESTLARNTATEGGAITATSASYTARSKVIITNSTISSNTATDAHGNIIYAYLADVDFYNTTIANNAIGRYAGPGIVKMGTPRLYNTLLVPDLAGLRPLQDNGGPTWTHALLPGNPAIGSSTDGSCLPTDQRGVQRADGGCDTGAFEASYPPTVYHIASHTADSTIIVITENGRISDGTNQLEVRFSELMQDPEGSSETTDVTNPASYLLLKDGPDNLFQTANCGSVQGDDVIVPIDTVSWDPVTLKAQLYLNGGSLLSSDAYRFFACGASLKDLEGHALDGSRTGVSGGDYVLNFSVQVKQPGPDFTVNVTEDINDGLCSDYHCSLREAVIAANSYLNGEAIIHIPAGAYALSISGSENTAAMGDLDLTRSMTIIGEGADNTIIDGNQLENVFDIFNPINVTLSSLTIQNGHSISYVSGGGIHVSGSGPSQVTIINAAVTGNTTKGFGGAIAVENSSSTLTILNSVISQNHAAGMNTNYGHGGAIYNTGTVNIINSTISGNFASNSGGAIYNKANLYINNVTITGNTANDDGDTIGSGGGIYNYSSGITRFKNTVIAGNVDLSSAAPDCGGTNVLISEDYNLISSLAGCTLNGIVQHNLTNVDPLLGPLQNNQGPTFTHALQNGSPAINAGDPLTCAPTDQRGIPRDPNCDIGAYESSGLLIDQVPPIVVDIALLTSSTTVTQIKVNFSEPVQNPAGHSEWHDVTNSASYLLVEDGADEIFHTSTCGTVQGDDTSVVINSVAYHAALYTATLSINNSAELPPGNYRLLVCSTIQDMDGHLLDGNRDGTGGDDHQAAFVVDTVQSGPLFTVTTTRDDNDGACGVIHCSLREAIIAANATYNSTVNIPAGSYRLTRTGAVEDATATGDLDIKRPMAFVGAGASVTIIDANGIDRVFDVRGGTVSMSDLTIQGGQSNAGESGGGIKNTANLTLIRVTIADNTSTQANGGGIANSSSLTMANCLVENNTAANGAGGGLYTEWGIVEIGDSTFRNNAASGNPGGGIYHTGGTLTLRSSTVADNQAASGGGIAANRVTGTTTLNITNSTISGNRATADGGGIKVAASTSSYLNNVTVTANRADADGVDGGLGGGLYVNTPGRIWLKNSIIAGNMGGESPDCSNGTDGILESQDYNLIGDLTNCTITGTLDHNIVGVDPLLGPLQNNGGLTFTHALLSGSPALDAGNNATCALVDQRSISRPQQTACDIGAYEHTAQPYELIPPTITRIDVFGNDQVLEDEILWSGLDQLTLLFSETMKNPLGDSSQPDVTNQSNYKLFHAGANGIMQTTACGPVQGDDQDIPITSISYNDMQYRATLKLSLTLPSGRYRFFACNNSGLQDIDGNALDGDRDGNAGGYFTRNFAIEIEQVGTITVTTYDDVNDGFCSFTHCSLREAILAGNQGGNTSIILPAGTYILTIAGSSESYGLTGDLDITANLALHGSGAGITTITTSAAVSERAFEIKSGVTVSFEDLEIQGGGIQNAGTLSLSRCTIAHSNHSGLNGGAIYNAGTLSIYQSTLHHNSAIDGGAIYNAQNGRLTLSASTINNNQASGRGGGIFQDGRVDGNIVVKNTTFSGNSASVSGGAINHNSPDSSDDYPYGNTITLQNVTITRNTSSNGGGIYAVTNAIVNSHNSIIALNTDNNSGDGSYPDLSGKLSANGYNLIGSTSGTTGISPNGNITGVDPKLGQLQNNGGLTQTHALLAGSPAIGAGNYAQPDSGTVCEIDDQRSVSRQGEGCDIGAYEVSGPFTELVPPMIVNVNSFAETLDGRLTEGEKTSASITQLQITFSKAMFDPSGDTDSNDITNSVNYRLLVPGLNGFFETTSCGSVQSDDGVTTIDSASYDSTLFRVALSINNNQPLPANRYRLLVCASLQDHIGLALDGNQDGTSSDNFALNFMVGEFPPTVTAINTVQDTGDGLLLEDEVATVEITQFKVTFSEQVSNPAGHTASDDVTNPANYRLVSDGSDNIFQTLVCGVAQGDDINIPINSVSYSGATITATISVNSGIRLPADHYRLFVCAPIVDTDWFGLDGDSDGLPGGDFTRTFYADPTQTGTDLYVNLTADTNDGQCGGLNCSLREAIIEANRTLGHTVIHLPAGTYILSITGRGENLATTGDLDITQDLTLIGAGADVTAIDGGSIDRIFHIQAAANVNMSGITIQNGNAEVGTPKEIHGGGIYIRDAGVVTLSDIIVANNAATGGGGISHISGGLLTLRNCVFQNNSAIHAGGGFYNSSSNVTVVDSSFIENTAEDSGAMRIDDTSNFYTTHISNSVFKNNHATESAGSIMNNGGTMSITGSIFTGNTAMNSGGAIFSANYSLAITNSIIANNSTRNDAGGLIGNNITLTNVTLSGNSAGRSGGAAMLGTGAVLNNVTVTNNIADSDNDGVGDGGGLIDRLGNPSHLRNTIVYGNVDTGGQAPDCAGNMYSDDYNLIGTLQGCALNGTFTHVLIGKDPKLGPLQNNGGPTDTHELLPGSAAINAGNPATPGSGSTSCAITDQRGTQRPQNEICDLGAFEQANYLDISVEQTDSPDPVHANEEVTYIVTVSNDSPTNASAVTLTDTLPDDIRFVSAEASQGPDCTRNYELVTCPLGSLASGATATVTIIGTVEPIAAAVFENTATVTAADDMFAANNTSTETTTIAPSADLSVSQIADRTAPVVGSTITFTITVANQGPDDASTIQTTATLPSELIFVSCDGNCQRTTQTVTFELDTLAAGSETILTLKVRANAVADTATRTVEVSAVEYDPDPSNNMATLTLTIDPALRAPTNLAASHSQSQTELTWTDNSNNETDFVIERSSNQQSAWIEIGSVEADIASYSDTTTLACGTIYLYRVRAHHSLDELYSDYSNTAEVTTEPCPPPAIPTDLSASGISPAHIDLIWADNSSDETAFHIERSPDGTLDWNEIGTTGADHTTYSDTDLTCETTYFYRVRAYRSSDDQYSEYSTVGSASTVTCPPAAPDNLIAMAASETQIDLVWTDRADDEIAFHIERSGNGAATWAEIGTVPADQTSYQDTGLGCGMFHYRMRAYRADDGQFSEYSNVAQAATSICLPPSAPTELTAAGISPNRIKLVWIDNADDETAFHIERVGDGEAEWAEIGTTGTDHTTYADTGLSCGTSYTYRVRAYRAGDTLFSGYSNTARATTYLCPPALVRPANHAATRDTTPTFVWSSIQGSTRYQLQIDNNADFASPVLNRTMSTTSYTLASPLSSQRHYWRVRVQDVAGHWSTWSNRWTFVVDTTPPAVPVLISPANGATIRDNTPTLSWRASTGTSQYQLQMDNNANFSSPIVNISTPETRYMRTASLGDRVYYWRMRARDAAGNWSRWSARYSFTLNAIRPMIQMTPDATMTPTPTATVIPMPMELPLYGAFDNRANWLTDGVWQVDAQASLDGPAYFAGSTTRDQVSTLTYAGLIDLSSAQPIALRFWQKSLLTNADRLIVELSLTGGLTWIMVDDQAGTISEWREYMVDLTAYRGQIVGLRFRLDTTAPLATGTSTIGVWLDSLSIEAVSSTPTPLPTGTLAPTVTVFQTPPPTSTTTPIPTDGPSKQQLVESDDLVVQQIGTWTAHTTDMASGGSYLYSSGRFEDVLNLAFVGTQVEIIYVQHPALGTFAVEIDGAVFQIVNSVATESTFGAQTTISGLADGPHALRIVPVAGVIAIDAFGVDALVEVTATPTPTLTEVPTQTITSTELPPDQSPGTPTAVVTEEPPMLLTPTPTTTPLPAMLPFIDTFDSGLNWQATSAWTLDTQNGYRGAGWFASSTTRGQISTLTYGAPIDLRTALNPQLNFWHKAGLTSSDLFAVDLSLDGGLTWQPVDQQSGLTTDWTQRTLDLTAYRGLVISLRFRLHTLQAVPDGSTTTGIWLDELVIQDTLLTPTPTDGPPIEPSATDVPTNTPVQPTETPTATPTLTPVPTDIPLPTLTPTDLPTDTTTPSATPTAAPTLPLLPTEMEPQLPEPLITEEPVS